MKSFADWTSEIAAANNPTPVVLAPTVKITKEEAQEFYGGDKWPFIPVGGFHDELLWVSQATERMSDEARWAQFYEFKSDGTIKWHGIGELERRGLAFEDRLKAMREFYAKHPNAPTRGRITKFDMGEPGDDKTVMTHRIQGKTGDVMLVDELTPPDFGKYDFAMAGQPCNIVIQRGRRQGKCYAERVGQMVTTLLQSHAPGDQLIVGDAGNGLKQVEIIDRMGTLVHRQVVT